MLKSVKTAHNNGDARAATKAVEDYMAAEAKALHGTVPGEEIKTIVTHYDPEETFRRLLLDLDADFLLRHVAAEDHAHLNRIAGLWRDLSIEAVQNAFWPGRKFQTGRLRSLCSESVCARLRDLDVELLCSEALTEFAAGRMRVPRWALETGQRMLVSRQQPVFFAVQSEDELLRSWRSYLGRRLRRVVSSPELPTLESFESVRENRIRDCKNSGTGSYDDLEPDEELGVDEISGLGSY